jgi:uncharacterized protein (TIGR00270 family)
LHSVHIEGTIMKVCISCSNFGTKIQPQKIIPIKKKFIATEPEISVIENYSCLIKHAREKKNQKQGELALAVGEKLSLIQKVESGHKTPSIALARKLEKFFHITLIEKISLEGATLPPSTTKELTIADLLKKK